ncbi:MAG TPA: AbrB/MazE/SpoVT family DNA-binding domain-containing protein [Patescibacteria group bacterium]|nr:AbrB/MazE/SpoVT family DNA-binding domain-containing protein [Patescibacteria group bacterium]
MYTQTVFAAGNSLVVTVPKEIVRKLNLKPGSRVVVGPLEGNRFYIEKPTPTKPIKKSASEKEFKSWLAQTLEEDSEILDELAKH